GACREATAGRSRDQVRPLLPVGAGLARGASGPVGKVGRMAGQFAKPRSGDEEARDGGTLPTLRGDAVNGHAFTLEARTPDPQRLWRMYTTSASTLNLLRAFTGGGFADLREVHSWNRGFTSGSGYDRYEELAGQIDKAIRFMAA